MNSEELKAEYKRLGLRYYTPNEELWHCITHGLPIAYFAVGLVFLLLRAEGAREIIASVVFSFFTLWVYVNSTIYHGLTNLKLKSVWRRIDHSGIPFIVVGCGAPAAIIYTESSFNLIGLGLSVAVAVLIIVLMFVDLVRFNYVGLALNFVIGAFIIAIFVLNMRVMPKNAVIFSAVGAAISAVSGLWYLIKKPYMHVVFHVLCAVGPMVCYWGAYYML